jgi:hypothetical protein
MKQINRYITEKFKINSKTVANKVEYTYYPKDWTELKDIIIKLIKERGYDADLNDIDVSKITNMNALFNYNKDTIKFNGDISEWNVSNVKVMNSMFFTSEFNGDISKWDVSNVFNMTRMFEYSKFN